jgi:hypothetical protein
MMARHLVNTIADYFSILMTASLGNAKPAATSIAFSIPDGTIQEGY